MHISLLLGDKIQIKRYLRIQEENTTASIDPDFNVI